MSHKKRYTPDIFGWFLWHIFFICHLIILKFGNKLKGIKIHIWVISIKMQQKCDIGGQIYNFFHKSVFNILLTTSHQNL